MPSAKTTTCIGADSLMHPVLHPRPFTAPGWIFENKFDGFRALARKSAGKVELLSRSGRSLVHASPEVVESSPRIQRVLHRNQRFADSST
jgi:hypothetical protein